MIINGINTQNTSFGLYYRDFCYITPEHEKILKPLFKRISKIGKSVNVMVKSDCYEKNGILVPAMVFSTSAKDFWWGFSIADPTRFEAIIPTPAGKNLTRSEVLLPIIDAAKKTVRQIGLMRQSCKRH